MADWTDTGDLAVTVGGLPRASWANSAVDNLEYLYNPPAVSVRLNATQEVGNNSDSTILWNESPWDSTEDGMWDDGSPGVILIRRPGRYMFTCSVLWAEAASGDSTKRAIFLERDDVRIRGVQMRAVNPAEQQLTGITNLAEDAYLEFVVRQSSGAALNMQSSRTIATVQWVGPLL